MLFDDGDEKISSVPSLFSTHKHTLNAECIPKLTYIHLMRNCRNGSSSNGLKKKAKNTDEQVNEMNNTDAAEVIFK